MLDHLMEIEYDPAVLPEPAAVFTPVKKLDATEMLDAQVKTTDWLKSLGATSDEEVADAAQQGNARDAFKAMVTNPTDAKAALAKVTQSAAVRQIVGMLSTYDWAFVEQAQQLRSMAVAKIVDETEHPDARIRLKALELLGRVTEVGLFTDRIEVKKTELSDSDLDARIKEKLAALGKSMKSGHTDTPNDVIDAEYTMTVTPATDADTD